VSLSDIFTALIASRPVPGPGVSQGIFLVKSFTSQNPPGVELTLWNAYLAAFVPDDLILINHYGGPVAANPGSCLLALFADHPLTRVRKPLTAVIRYRRRVLLGPKTRSDETR
jgi:hypothetical protein